MYDFDVKIGVNGGDYQYNSISKSLDNEKNNLYLL